MSSYQHGLAGEAQAISYLKQMGLEVLATRYRAEGGEIDIIAREGEVLCFIEVKYRAQGRLGDGLLSVTADKRRRLEKAARAYLSQEKRSKRWRFDTLEITRAGIWYARHASRSD